MAYVTPTEVTRAVESFLFGRRRDYYSSIGPSNPHAVDFEAGNWRENCACHLTVDWIKGRERNTRAIGNGSRNFEPWSSSIKFRRSTVKWTTLELELHSSDSHTTPMRDL
ncbi:hypothetical protein TNCV_2210241 [Trichonephila clavipes]|nr:hypothetical protein TNCV_2210241 [Trichonephila clavipes]